MPEQDVHHQQTNSEAYQPNTNEYYQKGDNCYENYRQVRSGLLRGRKRIQPTEIRYRIDRI